jgi:amino acid transporter
LLLVFAYSGFEAALIPAGEIKNPARDVPVALLAALAIVTTVHSLVQLVVVRTLANPGQTDRPLWAAANVFGSTTIATIVSLGALLSTFGTLAAHPRYQTPYVSIVAFAVLLWALALIGTFRWNATLSAASRLFAYGTTCAALPMLRKKLPGQEAFHLPGGLVFAVLGIAFALVLVSRMGAAELIALAITAGLSFLNWLAVRGNTPSPAMLNQRQSIHGMSNVPPV